LKSLADARDTAAQLAIRDAEGRGRWGGKGMRQVAAEGELNSALETATSEAQAAFGSAEVYLEKVVERPRHIGNPDLGRHERQLCTSASVNVRFNVDIRK